MMAGYVLSLPPVEENALTGNTVEIPNNLDLAKKMMVRFLITI